MSNQILDYFAETDTGYLHAHGRVATNSLVDFLDCKAGEKILEIGFGTGTTLVEMAAKYPQTHFYGLEVSKAMFDATSKRLKFCGLSQKIQLEHAPKLSLPYGENTFDRVYVESVLAIQEGEELREIFLQINKVLKPTGVLLLNETIWLDTTDNETIEQINAWSKQSFGIIQANAKYPYLANWKALLSETKFSIQEVSWISEIKRRNTHKATSLSIWLSGLYSFIGRLKSKLNGRLRYQWLNFRKEMESPIYKEKTVMDGILIKAHNIK